MSSVFSLQERVRWIDCDAARIIHYGAYIRFFEIAETEMYRSVGLPYATAFDSLGCFPIRAAYHCEYSAPARLDDLMTISIWVSHWGRTSFTVSFRFERASDGLLLADGWCRQVTVDLEEKRPMPIPEALRDRFEPYALVEA